MRKPLLRCLLLCLSAITLSAQTLFWELPTLRAPSGVSYSASASNGEYLALSWQERTGTGTSSAVSIYIDTARLGAPNTDTRWSGRRLLHGPVPLAGVGEEPRMHAIAMDDRRILAAVVLPSATGAKGSEVLIKSSGDGGTTFRQVFSFTAETVVTSPDLSMTADGGWLLLLTQPEKIGGVGAQETQGKLSIAYCTSRDGERWSALMPMVTEPILTQNIQPHHVVMGKTEYVVFQSKRITNHLYLTWSTDGGSTWTGKPIPITSGEGFAEAAGGRARTPDDFNNQRPYLAPLGDRLALAWERALVGSDQSQVYYCELDRDGAVVPGTRQVVTRGNGALFPQLVQVKGELRLLYAERQLQQTRLMLATRSGSGAASSWSAISVAPSLEAGTLVPHGLALGDRLFVFSEVLSAKNAWALYAIRPDTTAPAPVLRPLDFPPDTPANRDRVAVAWDEPGDPSRIASYRYAWALDGSEATTTVLAGASQRLVLDAPSDGTWRLTVWAVDRAGNSTVTPAAITFVRDATPPARVTMYLQPAPLLNGYQPTNDFTISWVPPPGDTIEGYEVSDPLKADGGSLVRQRESLRAVNVNDGDYIVTVAAVDRAGNVGPAATISLRLDRYQPVTRITGVVSTVDQRGNLLLEISGLGFRDGGSTPEVYLDDDAKPPYAYTLKLSDEQYEVASDRIIRGITLGADFDSGTYRVGVRHAVRGVRFADQAVDFQAPGTVKIGDFSFRWAPRWATASASRYHLPFVALLIGLSTGLVAVLLVVSSRSLVATAREGTVLKAEVQALLEGRPALITVEETERRLKALKRRGIGLRVKFSFLVSILAIIIVAGVAVPLGVRMIRFEQQVLVEELLKRSNLLLDSAAARAAAPLRAGDSGFATVSNIPASRDVMSGEARYLTVTGPSVPPSENPVDRDYLWATNDPSWPEGSYVPAQVQLDDKALGRTAIARYMAELNAAAAEDLKDRVTEIRRLSAESDRLAKITLGRNATAADDAAYKAAQDRYTAELSRARARIDELAKRDGRAGVTPGYDPRNLAGQYLLYRPVVDFVQDGRYALGMVRLLISTVEISREIDRATSNILKTMLYISLAAIAAGIVGAVILAGITIRPVKKLAIGVAKIRDTEDKATLEDIDIDSRDEIGTLAEAVNDMTRGLRQAAIDKAEILVGKDLQKKFLPLETEKSGKGSTGGQKTDRFEVFGYYEGAKGVSGDYFDFQPLDDRHVAIINCDVAGKGVSAAMIMVEVATLFLGWCRDWRRGVAGGGSNGRGRLDTLVYTINDMLEERGFKGRFAATTVALFDLDTGVLDVCTAGNNVLHVYDADRGSIVRHPLPQTPAAGVWKSSEVAEKSGFPQVRLPLDRGDALFLFTDGFEESKRAFRTYAGDVVPCLEPGLKVGDLHLETHTKGQADEEFGIPRINGVVNAVFQRAAYRLERHHTATREDLEFDFSSCTGTVKEAVLALVCVEKVFRVYRDALTGPGHVVHMETKVDDFLSKHFRQYPLLFDHRREDGKQGGTARFSHLKEDPQYDDLTLLVVRRP